MYIFSAINTDNTVFKCNPGKYGPTLSQLNPRQNQPGFHLLQILTYLYCIA